MVTSKAFGNMVPETLDNYICMVSCYIIIRGSHLVFVCVMVTSIEYGNMVPETLENYEGGSICNENPFTTPSTNA